MIPQILPLTRPLIVFDLETTGTDTDKHRIVQFGFQLYTAEGLVKEYECLVNPGTPIPPEVTEVHGISDADVADALTFAQLAPNLAPHFVDCDFGGKNVRFDLRMFEAEMRRAGVSWNYATARIIDAERLEQLAVPRSLSHLYKKYTGEELVGAHGALADVRASAAVIFHQLSVHKEVLPLDLDKLHELQWPGRIDLEGKFVFKNGVATCMFGKYRGHRMTAIPPDYWRFILKSDFSAEIKALANNALRGLYPEAK
jgi:DNA polymerase-3 subunit epsilon